MKLRTVLAALCLLLVQQPASAAFSRLNVLGDSLSDVGRFFVAMKLASFGTLSLPNTPYLPGHFSNGPVWVEWYRAAHPEIEVESLAMGGAFSGPVGQVDNTADILLGGLPLIGPLVQLAASGLNTQLTYVQDVSGTDTAFALWIGANDIQNAQTLGFAAPADIVPVSLLYVGNAIDQLLAKGATQVFVANLPDLGRTPDAAAGGNAAGLTAATLAFNAGIDALAAGRGPQVRVVDIYSAFNVLMASAAAIGLDTTTPCVDGLFDTTACSDPNSHVFWDGVHPTTLVHALVAQVFDAAFTAPVPLPASGLMVLPGLALLALRRRQAA